MGYRAAPGRRMAGSRQRDSTTHSHRRRRGAPHRRRRADCAKTAMNGDPFPAIDSKNMDAYISPPTRIPFYLRIGLWIVRRRTGVDLLPPRLLAWYPRAAISSGVVESLIAHKDGHVTRRMLKMVRMTVSFTASCPFCIGLNSQGWEALLTESELHALQGATPVEDVSSI